MRFLVAFENAAAEFDLGKSPQLALFRNGTSETIPTDGPSGYEAEIAHFIQAVRDSSMPLKATLDDAHLVTRVLSAERQSLKSGQPEKL
jgi:predicted dehydrogenase